MEQAGNRRAGRLPAVDLENRMACDLEAEDTGWIWVLA